MSESMMESSNGVIENPGRRRFLRAAPVAAAAGFALADASLIAAPARDSAAGGTTRFRVFTAEAIHKDVQSTEAHPGSLDLVNGQGVSFTMVMTTEKNKSAEEFEAHEHRDHVLQVLDGSTVYEVGGTPKGGRSIGPGEWRGKDVEGATKLTLHKGDTLFIPRSTPHKRSTADSVTFTLISPEGAVLK